MKAYSSAARLGSLVTVLASLPVHAEWRALETLAAQGASVSAGAFDLDSGRPLQQLQASTRLAPASLTKLAVTAATLDHWAPDKTFTTRVYATGEVKPGQIGGDLVLVGAGDPTLEYRSLLELAGQIKSAGVADIRGRIVVDLQPFPAVDCETRDRCEALQHSATAYNAPLAAVGVDYGNWCINVQPTTPGRAAKIRGCGVAQLPIEVHGDINTVAAGAASGFRIDRVTRNGVDELRIGGRIAAGPAQRVYRAMSNSALGVSLLLRETLIELGISVHGAAAVERGAQLPAAAQPIAQTEGLLLKEQLARMLRYSNNYIADVLTLDLAADLKPAPFATARLADAGRLLADLVYQKFEPRAERAAGPPILLSGSGLTPENRLSAADLVALLVHEYRDSRYFPAFYGGLVVPRQSPFAFLRQGGPDWLDRVALKTGTMEEPVSVCGIAGYLRKKGGGWIAFAAIVNGSARLPHVPIASAMAALRTDVEALLLQ